MSVNSVEKEIETQEIIEVHQSSVHEAHNPDIALFGIFALIAITITKALNYATKKHEKKVW